MKKLISLLATCSICGITFAFASDEASLNQAISSLNARAKTDAGKKLVLKAVSQQTTLPEKTLQSQMSATHLGYGELLTVNSIVQGSGKSLNAVLAMKKKGTGWTNLSKELRIDPNSIVNRLRNAEKTVRTGLASAGAGNITNQPDPDQPKPANGMGREGMQTMSPP